MNRSIAIIGAGIGGLTLAAFLQKQGLKFRVFEQAEKLGEVGAGIGLWANATNCLEQIGIDDRFWSTTGCEVHKAEIANPQRKVLSKCDVTSVTEKMGTGSFVVHRADLHNALSSLIDSAAIIPCKRLFSLEQESEGVTLYFNDGSEERSDLVIGADGLRSKVRSELFGEKEPVYSGQTCYRGIANLFIPERHVLREIQGQGLRAAVIPLDDQRVYWWATENVPEGTNREPGTIKEHLLSRFEGWAFNVPEAIAATDAGAILQNDLYDRPPLPTWSKGSATLLGDAAHPTTPNLGQGACMAIEDGCFLGKRLGKDDVTEVFSLYEKARKARCESIVKESRRFGWIGGWQNPLAVRLRETIYAATPESVMRRTMEKHMVHTV
ncbi:MAG: FAD-dependent monooxygenase [Verrucomicrobiales bacterium]|nr:FAD-dependent monooxygenase [Verrucomicrobiales bacterium]